MYLTVGLVMGRNHLLRSYSVDSTYTIRLSEGQLRTQRRGIYKQQRKLDCIL